MKSELYAVPLPDAIADVILLAFVFHEANDKERFIRELIRLLKKGGKIVVVEWDICSSPMGPPQEERISHEETKVIFEDSTLLKMEKHKKINACHYLDIYG